MGEIDERVVKRKIMREQYFHICLYFFFYLIKHHRVTLTNNYVSQSMKYNKHYYIH